MAGTEGSGQTDLLSGWSCVVHRPSEDPEPSELPSTVDIAAFSTGLNVEPTQNANNQDSCDSESDSDSESNNSGSDGSGSCSQSDSSDSESSSSSQGSSTRSSSPEFSVTSSQTNGLRLKIATVRKSCTSPVDKPKFTDAKPCDKNPQVVKSCNLSSSSESRCSRSSSDSSSDSDAPSSSKSDLSVEKANDKGKKPVAKVKLKQVEKKPEREKKAVKTTSSSPKPAVKPKTRSRRARKMASLPLSRGSTGSSSESEDDSESDRTMLASCSLQEIRQEDLAAILPDQQECDAFGGFDSRPDKSSPHTAGDGSGSDMELPQQAVNALIQRTTESSSESESRLPLNPNTLYSNSLLQQFVAQTQMLNAPCSAPPTETGLPTPLQITPDNPPASESENVKRKRGRPRKNGLHKAQSDSKSKTEPSLEYCGNPNVSPDSGIQNSSDHVSSPEPSPTPNPKPKSQEETRKQTEKSVKNNGESKANSKASSNKSVSKVVLKEQPKLPVTSNSFDRVLYGNTDRVLYPPRRKAGRPPTIRKGPGRPPKHKSVGAVEEVKPPDKSKSSENEPPKSTTKAVVKTEKLEGKSSKQKKVKNCDNSTPTNSNLNVVKKESKETKSQASRNSKSTLLHEICEKVSKRLDINSKQHLKSENKLDNRCPKVCKGLKHKKVFTTNRVVLSSKNKLDPVKVKYTTFKNSKVMHSKHKDKKHRKCKFRILKPITATIYDPKFVTEIDKLVADFVKLCNISSNKPAKENVPEMLKVLKKASKKRKASEYNERKKKKQNVSSSFNKETNSNEQRLPLKKRHYHLSTNNDSGTNTPQTERENDTKPKVQNNSKEAKSPTTACKVLMDKNKSAKSSPLNMISSIKPPEENLQEIEPPKPLNNNNNYAEKSPPKAEVVGSHIDEAIEACITKYSSPVPESHSFAKETPKVESSPKIEEKINNNRLTTTTPKKRHRLEAKNNAKEPLSVNNVLTEQQATPNISGDAQIQKAKTGPLENVMSELKAKKTLSPKPSLEINKKIQKNETFAQIITRKKNRLEDLTLTLAHKVNSSMEEVEDTQTQKKEVTKMDEGDNQRRKKDLKEETPVDNLQKRRKEEIDCQKRRKDVKEEVETQKSKKEHHTKLEEVPDSNQKRKKEIKTEEPRDNQKRRKEATKTEEISRATVIKSPVSKRIKPSEPENMDSVTTEEPTGIFMPTVDVELQIPASKIQTTHSLDNKVNTEPQVKLTKVPLEATLQVKPAKSAVVEEKETAKTSDAETRRKKIRKRRAFNRTGFPTVKKKKKRMFPLDCGLSEDQQQSTEERTICDRVPQEGEKYSSFLQRTEKLNVSNAILEKLQKSIAPSYQFDEVLKWDPQHEEESMHELGVRPRRPTSRSSIKPNRSKDASPASIISSYDKMPDDKDTDMDELSLEARLELLKASLSKNEMGEKWRTRRGRSLARSESLQKRRFKDVSPASSIEPMSEKKPREEISVSGDEARRTRRNPRWRKKYLVAGLFSDYYKEDDEATRLKRTEAATKKIIYNPQEHPYGLLPPPYHCGRYLRCRKIAFQLPYDLWWQHTNSQLPGRDMVPSWNYRKIRTNVYNVKTTAGACEPQACNCTSESGCGDDCINRLVLAECPATHKCHNQKIQRHEWAPGIEKFMTIDKGWGVRTKLPIKTGEFILEYVGEVVSDQEFKERMASRYAHDTHHYCLHLDGGLVIDGHRMGGDGRFVNHSCEPNCEMQKWSVNGQFRMALFALRDIEACEELTYDYNFSLFNPAEGQECKCGSMNCRGVIGGKSQRVRQCISLSSTSSQAGRVGRPRKNQAKRTTSVPKEPPVPPLPPPLAPAPPMKPLSNAQRTYVRDHHCFLLRNLNKARQNRERTVCSVSVARANTATPTDSATTFINHLNALRQPRNMKTRRLAQAEDNPELKKAAQLATILRDLLTVVTTAKDENHQLLCSPFMTLPSKRKVPEYYQRITDPIDLTSIEQNIATGVYRTVENFDSDMNKIFVNAVRFFGRTSEPGIAATRLKKIYCDSKQANSSKLEEVIGEKLPPNFVSNKSKNEEEDVIRCICGMFRDEGLMIQCERCLVWQHCECVRANADAASYHCERCVPRQVNYEISLDEYTEHGHQYYMTLLRGDLQLRQGDTVYVLRDIPIPGTDKKHTYDTIGEIEYSDLDIFRIERLWKDCKTGQRFAYGHHYLRPHETFHEPTRKFFPNEVMRVPLYEAVPVELIIQHCWVLDLNTFCKGRPIGAPEEHIYICEYRVDKSARLFSKISRSKYPVCTKSYAFDKFDVRLKISRTYTPHDLDPAYVKPRGRKPQENEDVRELPPLPVPVPVVRTQSEKKTRLNKILLSLLNKMPTKQVLDVSYLLEGGRRRKKQAEK